MAISAKHDGQWAITDAHIAAKSPSSIRVRYRVIGNGVLERGSE
jgi:hypothetical protein